MKKVFEGSSNFLTKVETTTTIFFYSRECFEHTERSNIEFWLQNCLFKFVSFKFGAKRLKNICHWTEWMILKLIFKRWKKFLRVRQIFSPKLKRQQQNFFYSRECFEHTECSNVEFWHQNCLFKFVSFKFGGKKVKKI